MVRFCRQVGWVVLFGWIAAAVADDNFFPDTDSDRVLDFIEQMQGEVEPELNDQELVYQPWLNSLVTLPPKEEVLAEIRSLTRALVERHGFDSDYVTVQSLAGIAAIYLVDGFLISGPVAHYLSEVIQRKWSSWGAPGVIGAYSSLSMIISFILLKNLKLIDDLSFFKKTQFALESAGVGQVSGALGWYISSKLWSTVRLKSSKSLWKRWAFGHELGSDYSAKDLDGYNNALHYILTKMAGTLVYYWARSVREGSRLRGERDEMEDKLARMQEVLTNFFHADENLINPEIDLETDYLPVLDHMHTD